MTPRSPTPISGGALVYGASLLQGLTVVSFPASSTVLRSMHGLSDTAYGSLFLPQTVFTIVGSLLGGAFARTLGLRRLLVASMLAALLSQVALLAVVVLPTNAVLPTLLLGTGLMGLGFGASAAPLNTYPALLFPTRGDSALVALHTAIGAGFSLGPVLVSVLVKSHLWPWFPALVGMGSAVIAISARAVALPQPVSTEEHALGARPSWRPLAVLGVIAVLYAFAEGTFSNWASIYLHDARGVRESVAALAISGFWLGLTLGRLVAAAIVSKVAPFKLWLGLPLAMVVVFATLPSVRDATTGIALFFAAGLACSAFFPLTVAIANRAYPGREALVSSLLIAALMIGVGGGSFVLGALRREFSFETIYRLSILYPLVAFLLGALTVMASSGLRARSLEAREST